MTITVLLQLHEEKIRFNTSLTQSSVSIVAQMNHHRNCQVLGMLGPSNTSHVFIFREVAGECISGMIIVGNPTQLDNGAWINVFKRQSQSR